MAGIREEVVNFFSIQFYASNLHRPLMEGFEFTSLSQEDINALSVPFTQEEIAKALTYCDSNKSLWP